MITYTGLAIAAYALIWVAMKELQRASWTDERKREFEQARQAVTASESLPFDFVVPTLLIAAVLVLIGLLLR